jgi:catalase
VAHFQRDGHMQTSPQRGRAAYEPNSFTGDDRGPREAGPDGHVPFPAPVDGQTRRIRAESFKDHYSQGRQFWLSQTPVEQDHIVAAYVFELGKCEIPAIRERMVANLRNVDESLAARVADGLGMPLPAASEPAAPVVETEVSPALSILANAKETFEGRKLGLLVGDGADAGALKRLTKAVEKAGGVVEVIAAKVGGATLSDGSTLVAKQAVAGAPSVLYDTVAIVAGDKGGATLADEPAARDFLTDAFTHYKVIALGGATDALVAATGLDGKLDEACLPVGTAAETTAYIARIAGTRHWERDITA